MNEGGLGVLLGIECLIGNERGNITVRKEILEMVVGILRTTTADGRTEAEILQETVRRAATKTVETELLGG